MGRKSAVTGQMNAVTNRKSVAACRKSAVASRKSAVARPRRPKAEKVAGEIEGLKTNEDVRPEKGGRPVGAWIMYMRRRMIKTMKTVECAFPFQIDIVIPCFINLVI